MALEIERLHQGLLTYALKEGLKDDKAAPDGKGPISIGAWLHYAEQRVPTLYNDIQAGRVRAVETVAAKDAPQTLPRDSTVNPAFRTEIANHAQTPQLFDFYKQTNDATLGTR